MDRVIDQMAAHLHGDPLAYWVLGSLLGCALGSHLLWLVRSTTDWRRPPAVWLLEVGRFLFFLGVPYLVLGGWPRPPFSGLLTLDDLGFAGIGPLWPATRWLASIGTGLGLGLAALLFLLLVRLAAERGSGDVYLHFADRPWWALLLGALYHEVHWAFYRSALAAALDDLYVGVFLGLGLVYLEWGLDPFWRQGWTKSAEAGDRWLGAALALIAALTFLLTRNLWVCLAVHGLALAAFRHRTANSK